MGRGQVAGCAGAGIGRRGGLPLGRGSRHGIADVSPQKRLNGAAPGGGTDAGRAPVPAS